MYRDASRVLDRLLSRRGGPSGSEGAGLKALALASSVRNKSKTYAVVCETLKYRDAMLEVLASAGLDASKLARSQGLLLAMLYDHLFGRGIQGGGAVKRAILKHDEALRAALAKIMAARGVTEAEELVLERVRNAPRLSRFARVNLRKKSVAEARAALGDQLPHTLDPHVPCLLRFEHGTDLHAHDMVTNGELILQDKSSCFPAQALAAATKGAGVDLKQCDALDATAAPGNKTSHLAAEGFRTVFAFDKSQRRLDLLRRRMAQAGVLADDDEGAEESKVGVVRPACRDFLQVAPEEPDLAGVRAILLDPSCSGSGMTGRVDHLLEGHEEVDASRLEQLSTFQLECVSHAMSFPQVSLVSYSTCSVHDEENECVVAKALAANPAFELVKALPKWPRRGREVAGLDAEQAACLVRVDPAQDDTCGFFVAVFRRKSPPSKRKLKMRERRKKRRKKRRGATAAANDSAAAADDDDDANNDDDDDDDDDGNDE